MITIIRRQAGEVLNSKVFYDLMDALKNHDKMDALKNIHYKKYCLLLKVMD
jgi:hypothetical protein